MLNLFITLHQHFKSSLQMDSLFWFLCWVPFVWLGGFITVLNLLIYLDFVQFGGNVRGEPMGQSFLGALSFIPLYYFMYLTFYAWPKTLYTYPKREGVPVLTYKWKVIRMVSLGSWFVLTAYFFL